MAYHVMQSESISKIQNEKQLTTYNFLKFFSLLLITFLPFSFLTAQITVSSDSQFNNLNLSAGDVVTWADGTYSNQEIIFIASGTASNPITLKAETPGGVKFTGETQINIAGDHLILG